MHPQSRDFDPPPEHGIFRQTPWAVISCPATATARMARAREAVCEQYWRPIFLIICARGFPCDRAPDLTQGFLLHLFQSDAIAAADPAKGRFRDFLRGALQHYLADVRERERTLRRGGGAPHLSLDDPDAVDSAALSADPATQGFRAVSDRTWARRLLARVFARLEAKYVRRGRGALFLCLKSSLAGEGDSPPRYDRMAAELGRPAGTLRSDARRLREQIRRMMAEELRQEVGPERLADEWESLREILREE